MCCLKSLLLFSSPIRVRLHGTILFCPLLFLSLKFSNFQKWCSLLTSKSSWRAPTAAVVVGLDDLCGVGVCLRPSHTAKVIVSIMS